MLLFYKYIYMKAHSLESLFFFFALAIDLLHQITGEPGRLY